MRCQPSTYNYKYYKEFSQLFILVQSFPHICSINLCIFLRIYQILAKITVPVNYCMSNFAADHQGPSASCYME